MRSTTDFTHYVNLAWIAWFRFLMRYRRTLLGPVWLLVGPLAFIAIIGPLYCHVNGAAMSAFIPHLAIGLVVWNFISESVINGTTVFQRNKAQILQGEMSLMDLTVIDVLTTLLQTLHQAVVIVAIFLIFELGIGLDALICLVGLVLLIINATWVAVLFGIVGVRYRDLSELLRTVMRIAFLATPIVWMPGEGARGTILGVYFEGNPFYHFIELIRAPLLGHPITLWSWCVVLAITVIGSVLAYVAMVRYSRFVPLWL